MHAHDVNQCIDSSSESHWHAHDVIQCIDSSSESHWHISDPIMHDVCMTIVYHESCSIKLILLVLILLVCF